MPASPIAESIVKDCVYRIATAAWQPGERLPPLRQAARAWNANHLTVLRAYRRLVELGLATSRERSGFFVAEPTTPPAEDAGLERLYATVARDLRQRGVASVVGAFRQLAEIAQARAQQQPECAFVECTAFQARGHAGEIEARLGIPCAALTVGTALPAGVRALVTTGFHRDEVARRARRRRARVLTVPIELSPDLVAGLRDSAAAEILVCALDAGVAVHFAADVARSLGTGAVVRSEACAVEDLEALLRKPRRRRAVVLSPSLWQAAGERRARGAHLHPFAVRIVPSAWRGLAERLGVPLAALV